MRSNGDFITIRSGISNTRTEHIDIRYYNRQDLQAWLVQILMYVSRRPLTEIWGNRHVSSHIRAPWALAKRPAGTCAISISHEPSFNSPPLFPRFNEVRPMPRQCCP